MVCASITLDCGRGSTVASTLADFLRFTGPGRYDSAVVDSVRCDGFTRMEVEIRTSRSSFPAFVCAPIGPGPFPAVVAFHQHGGSRHLGKSEVVGLVGDPLHAFAPELARRGVVVLAADAIGFEARRHSGGHGTTALPDDEAAHYNDMAYRLVSGDLLMTDLLLDAATQLSVLADMPCVDPTRIGVLGHSFGGTTALFHAAVDPRVTWLVASGAVGSFRSKIANGVGIELSLVIPGIASRWEIDDVLGLAAPRPVLVLSATDDPYTLDAPELVDAVRDRWSGSAANLDHISYEGGHALTRRRSDDLISWVERRIIRRGDDDRRDFDG